MKKLLIGIAIIIVFSCAQQANGQVIKTKYIDLSIAISNDDLGDPRQPEITYTDHKGGAESMKKFKVIPKAR